MKESIELIFFPAPGIGHLVSTVKLAELLIHKEHHISITIFIFKPPPFDSSSSPRLKFVTLPAAEDTPIDSYKPQVREFIEEIINGGTRLGGFVVDMFSTAMIDVANEFKIPTYVFYTSGAAVLGLLLHMQSIEDIRGDMNIPTYVNPFPAKMFPSALLDKDGFAMFLKISKLIGATKGIIVNTFLELESHAINTLSRHPNSPPVYPVGPILNLEGNKDNKDEGEEIMKWLDDQQDGSVAFLCFGSEGYFPDEQVREIASTLEHSGQRFLWALRRSLFPGEYHNLEEVLPNGFLEKTRGVGKVIGWAPQAAVLRHPAVGGFVSHCGWNSTLESIWFGKPMAAWPIYGEQEANAFQIVKEIGIGVEIKMDYKRDFKDGTKFSDIVRVDKIERGISTLMDPLNSIRLKAKEMSEKSRLAIVEGGSSYTSLGRFIEDVFSNVNNNINT